MRDFYNLHNPHTHTHIRTHASRSFYTPPPQRRKGVFPARPKPPRSKCPGPALYVPHRHVVGNASVRGEGTGGNNERGLFTLFLPPHPLPNPLSRGPKLDDTG